MDGWDDSARLALMGLMVWAILIMADFGMYFTAL
jgi:hypothetical protein